MEAARLEQVKELERQRNETAAVYQEKLELAEKRLVDAEESHRIECERMEIALREKLPAPGIEELQRVRDEAEAAAKEQNEKLNKKVADLENRLNQASKNSTEMIANMRDMSALLETEAKKREELTQERKKWMEQLEEMERQLEEARNSSEEESKLAAENVRLASEMLKAHSQAEKTLEVEKELITKQFTDKLKVANNERDKLASEMEALRAKMKVMESRIEDQRASLEQAERLCCKRGDFRRKDELASIQAELDAVRKEKAKLKEEVESLRSNNNGHPVPAARRTISNMSTYTYNTQTDFSEIEDVQRLRSEIDK
uniref:Myosin_tail_1 domain-containing protein n=1 Tax=Angiostrongylus cantonensis TaxID=6313 RepID=A0A158P6M2_ANGCA